MRCFRSPLLLVTVLSLQLCGAQDVGGISGATPNNGPKHTLAGTVVNSVTAEPIRKALLTMQTSTGQRSTFSDASGHFEIPNITDNQVLANCRKPGFVDRSNFLLNSSPSAKEAIVRLVPYGSITGRVLDDGGTPVEGAIIQLISKSVEQGKGYLTLGQSAGSDDDGHYELDGLTSGDYRVRLSTSNLPIFRRSAPDGAARAIAEMYAPQYAGGGLDLASAQVIHVSPGQSQQADFSTKIIPAYRVTGLVSPSSPFIAIVVEDTEGNVFPCNSRADEQTGRWIITGLPAGTWKIVGSGSRDGVITRGEQTVTITDHDIANVALTLAPIAPTPVMFTGSNGDENSGPVQVMLRSNTLSTQQQWGMDQVRLAPNTNGSAGMSFLSVPAGNYTLQAQPNGNFCIEEANMNGTNVGRDGLIIQPNSAPTPLTIGLRSDCATLDIQLKEGEVSQNATVLALGDNPLCQYIFFLSSQTAMGHLEHLTPGNYHVYAFDSVENLEYANRDAMQSFASTSVTLNSGSTSTIKLDLNKRASGEGEAQ